jgi:hypothetical protein
MDRKEEYGKREFLLTWVGAPKDPKSFIVSVLGTNYSQDPEI